MYAHASHAFMSKDAVGSFSFRARGREMALCARSRVSPDPAQLNVESAWQPSTAVGCTPPITNGVSSTISEATVLGDPFSIPRDRLLRAVEELVPKTGFEFEGSEDDEDGVYEWSEDSVVVRERPAAAAPVETEPASLEFNALRAFNQRLTPDSKPSAQPASVRAVAIPAAPPAEVATNSAVRFEERVAGAEADAVDLVLPAIPPPLSLPRHRTSGDVPSQREAIGRASKFRERWQLFVEQLVDWGYCDDHQNAKKGVLAASRANPDLLYHLPAREVHLFVKKVAALSSRSLERKVRAGVARLANLYTAFDVVPTFNGSPAFQDVLRLLLFVSMADFQELEAKAPGIVASASDLLPLALDAMSQPAFPEAPRDHAAQLVALRDAAQDAAARQLTRKRQSRIRLPQLPYRDELQEEARLESREARIAARLRSGEQDPKFIRPWTPWDEADASSEAAGRRNSRARDADSPRSDVGAGARNAAPAGRAGRGAADAASQPSRKTTRRAAVEFDFDEADRAWNAGAAEAADRRRETLSQRDAAAQRRAMRAASGQPGGNSDIITGF